MITVYSIPRAFEGPFEIIQDNAVQSWLAMRPVPQVILFGDSRSAYVKAQAFGVPYLSVEADEEGIPLVSNAIEQARRLAQHDIRAFVNGDNLLLSDFVPAVQRVAGEFETFLIIGRRYCLRVDEHLDFRTDWEGRLRDALAQEPDPLHHYSAIDYLIYRGEVWDDVPPFSVGRGAYDGWLVRRALDRGVPVIDATEAMTVIHEDHPTSSRPTSDRNHELFVQNGGRHTTIQQATWALGKDGALIKR